MSKGQNNTLMERLSQEANTVRYQDANGEYFYKIHIYLFLFIVIKIMIIFLDYQLLSKTLCNPSY